MDIYVKPSKTPSSSQTEENKEKTEFMLKNTRDKLEYLYDEIEKLKALHPELNEDAEPTEPTEQPEPTEPTEPTEPIVVRKQYLFTSYGDEEGNTVYSVNGTVETTGQTLEVDSVSYIEVKVIENPGFEEFVNKNFFVISSAEVGDRKYQLYKYENEELSALQLWVQITEEID